MDRFQYSPDSFLSPAPTQDFRTYTPQSFLPESSKSYAPADFAQEAKPASAWDAIKTGWLGDVAKIGRDWRDPSMGWGKHALWGVLDSLQATIGAPASALARGVTYDLGMSPRSSFLEAALDYADQKKYSGQQKLVAGAGGLGLDILTDPLVAFTGGGGEAYKAARSLLNKAATDATVLSEDAARISPHIRQAGRLANPEEVAQRASPQIVADTVWNGAGQHLSDENRQRLVETFEHAAGDANYRKLVDQYRNAPDPRGEQLATHPDLWSPTLKPAERADLLARHQAWTEQNIVNQAPAIRFYGINTGLPSPTDTIGRGFSRLFGEWKDVGALAEPAVAHGVQPEALMQLFPHHITNPEEAARATVGDVERLARRYQHGPNADQFGLITGSSEHPEALDNFLRSDMLGHAPADRQRVFDNWNSLYKMFDSVKTQTRLGGKLLPWVTESPAMSAFKDQIQRAVLRFDKLAGRAATLPHERGQIDRFAKSIIDPDTGQRPIDEAISAFQTAHNDITKHLAATTSNAVKNATNTDVQGTVDFVYQLRKDIFNTPDNKFTDWAKAVQHLSSAKVPFTYGRSERELVQNAVQSGKAVAEEAQRFGHTVHEYLHNQVAAPLNGMEMIAKMGAKHWEDQIARSPFSKYAADPATADIVRNLMKRETARLADPKVGRITPQQAAEITGWLDTKTPDELYKFTVAFSELNRSFVRERFASNVLAEMTDKLAPYFAAVNTAMRQGDMQPYHQLANMASYWQSHYHPTVLGRLAQPLLKSIDGLNEAAFRFAGISPRIAEVVSDNDHFLQRANNDADAWAKRWHNQNIESYLVKNFPEKYGRGIPLQTVNDVNEGLGDILQFRLGRLYTHPEGELHGETKAVRDIAVARVEGAYNRLEPIFGSRRAIDQFLDAPGGLWENIQGHTGQMFDEAVKTGAPVNFREQYMPLVLRGSNTDVKHFYEWVETKHMTDALQGAEKGTVIASDFYAPAKIRQMENAAELQRLLDRFHYERATWKPLPLRPLDLSVESNLTAILAYRKSLNNRFVNSMKFLADLNSVLPEAAMPVQRGGTAPKTSMKHLGDLLPQWRGWYVTPGLYGFLEGYANRSASTLEQMVPMAAMLHRFQRFLKQVNSTWFPVHLKNLVGEQMVAAQNAPDIHAMTARNFLGVFKPERVGWQVHPEVASPTHMGAPWERVLTAMKPYMDGIKNHPLYSTAEYAGAFPFEHEGLLPVPERVRSWMRPIIPQRSAPLPWVKEALRGRAVGPWDNLTFGVYDRSARMAVFEKAIQFGMSPRAAADMSNRYMIDYSLKGLNPHLKNWAQGLFPFAAWTLGNWSLHATNVVENPRWYALVNHMRDAVNEQYSQVPPTMTPEALAGAFATPWMDGPFHQWRNPHLPWQSQFGLMGKVLQHPLPTAVSDVGHYVANTMWPLAPTKILIDAMDPSAKREAEVNWKKAGGGWHALLDFMKTATLGNDKGRGLMEETLWGMEPLYVFARRLMDPQSWTDPQDAMLQQFLDAIGIQEMRVQPDLQKGLKVYYGR